VDAVHMMNTSVSGNLVLLTIFDTWQADKGFPVVQSRHTRLEGSSRAVQLYGWCKPPAAPGTGTS
jgi:hypothetical protein